MANTETTGSGASQKKGAVAESSVEKSLAEFFDKMSGTLERIGTSHQSHTPPAEDKRFEIYAQAFQGFAQNNVSKKEGFALEVKLDQKAYDAFIAELIKQRRTNPWQFGGSTIFE